MLSGYPSYVSWCPLSQQKVLNFPVTGKQFRTRREKFIYTNLGPQLNLRKRIPRHYTFKKNNNNNKNPLIQARALSFAHTPSSSHCQAWLGTKADGENLSAREEKKENDWPRGDDLKPLPEILTPPHLEIQNQVLRCNQMQTKGGYWEVRRFERAVSKTLGSGGDKQAGNRKSGSQKTTQNHRIGVLTKPLPTFKKKANFFCFFFSYKC